MRILSRSQLDTLGSARSYARSPASRYLGDGGWFFAQHHECAPVITRWQTCASLCGMGLLEYETVSYHKTKGKWRASNKYRITQRGYDFISRYEQTIGPI
jgi:hypothetical protein